MANFSFLLVFGVRDARDMGFPGDLKMSMEAAGLL